MDSPDKKSVLDKCQTMKDCPAGQICEKYDNMKYTLDYMVEAEVLLGYGWQFSLPFFLIALLLKSFLHLLGLLLCLFHPFRSIDQNQKVCQKGCLPTIKPCPSGEECDVTSPWDVGVYG